MEIPQLLHVPLVIATTFILKTVYIKRYVCIKVLNKISIKTTNHFIWDLICQCARLAEKSHTLQSICKPAQVKTFLGMWF
ncbi:hypothetical protein FKM82_031016 [Ascaphus truei]